MAIVIVSAGGLPANGARTLSLRSLLLAASAAICLVAGAAFSVGVGVGRGELQESPNGPSIERSAGRVLIDRVGELTGRLARLEGEALTLARRIGVLDEFETRQREVEASQPRIEGEGKRPATPAGGPLIPPIGEDVSASSGAVFDDHGIGLSALEREFARLDAALGAVADETSDRDVKLMAQPNRSPVPGVEPTSSFGRREDPFNRRAAFHSGVDFPARSGTQILASGGGRVIHAGYRKDYGYTVEIDHGNGLVTRYAHCSRLFVKSGEVVAPGQRIAAVGSTGRSTGAHLHFEVLENGLYANPERFLAGF